MLPSSAFIGDFPVREAKQLAVFNSIGLVYDAAGLAGKWRVWSGVRHGSTVRL
jgi:hypothetical protein